MKYSYQNLSVKKIKALFKGALSGNPTRGNQNIIITKDGSERWVEWNDNKLRDENGDFDGILAIGQDITERKRVEDQLNNKMKDLKDFHGLAVGREEKMIELKGEVNKLAKELGRPEPYDLSFLEK